MANANTASKDGDKFQARQFWLKAARLLDSGSSIERVGFERGPKGLDDIFVEYAHGNEPKDHTGNPLKREYLQCKWHVQPGSFGYADLIAPEFINATSKSFLQRARDAQLAQAPDGFGIRFKLLTNWPIEPTDKLSPIINNRSGALRLNKLFDGKTDKSHPGNIRKVWRDHLDIEESELHQFAHTLAFGHAPESLDQLRERLDETLSLVGLKRFPLNESSLVYDDLPFEWMAQGKTEFDRDTFRSLCASENLLDKPKAAPSKAFGIKSFEHAFDRLEDRCEMVLDFVPNFDERYIHDSSEWARTLYPELYSFLQKAFTHTNSKIRLALDAHSTLAYAAGSIVNIKSGRDIELEQRTQGSHIWSAQDCKPDPSWAQLNSNITNISGDSTDLAVALCITHDIAKDVEQYIRSSLPSIKRVLELRPSCGPGSLVVKSGRHAFDLAEATKEAIRHAKHEAPDCRNIHLFVAAPNSLCFFLGQQQIAIGSVQLYEFDFDQQHGGSYEPSLALPMTD